MGYRQRLVHRCEVQRLTPSNADGAPSYSWKTIQRRLWCLADLAWTPPGMNMFVVEAGRPADRVGTMFLDVDSKARPGDRLVMTVGPEGTFTVGANLLQVPGRRGTVHHIEATITEVAQALGQEVVDPGYTPGSA